jgi:radical SAM protein with 4Fe4S-binding SPASM domain
MDFYEKLGFGVLISPAKLFNETSGGSVREEETYAFFRRLFSGMARKHLESFNRVLNESAAKPPRKNLCSGRYCVILVDPQGGVFPCVPFRNYPLGNLLEQRDLAKIFSSERMKKIQRLTVDDYPECIACKYRNFCTICIGNWFTRLGKLGVKDDQLCNYARALSDVIHERSIV